MTTDKTEMKTETICYGDCLEHLKLWVRWNNGIFEGKPSLADLIYLDPPWNSGKNYNHLFGPAESSTDNSQSAQEIAFEDMWQWGPEAKTRVDLITGAIDDPEYHPHPDKGHPAYKSIFALKHLLGETGMLAYCAYMAERLALLRELLKPTGSIYLHCDPHASHYLKMIMDNIFGPENFRNQIVWKRTTSDQKGSHHKSKSWGNNTDIIFFYVKSDANKLNPFRPLTKEEIEAKFAKTDEKGRKYQDDSAHIFCNKIHRAAPSLCYEWKGFFPPHPSSWRLSKSDWRKNTKEAES